MTTLPAPATLFPILYARDFKGIVRFYQDRLGMRESYRYPPEGEPVFVTLCWGDAQLGLGTYDPAPGLEGRGLRPPGAGRGFELCVYVPAVDTLVAQLRSQGVPVLVAPVDQPWGERVAYVQDPEGNAVMLVSPLGAAGDPPETRSLHSHTTPTEEVP